MTHGVDVWHLYTHVHIYTPHTVYPYTREHVYPGERKKTKEKKKRNLLFYSCEFPGDALQSQVDAPSWVGAESSLQLDVPNSAMVSVPVAATHRDL